MMRLPFAALAALALSASDAPAQMYYGNVYGNTAVGPYGARNTGAVGRTVVTPGGTVIQGGSARTTGFGPYSYGTAQAQGVRVTTPYGATYTRGSAGGFRSGPFGTYGGRVGGFGFRR